MQGTVSLMESSGKSSDGWSPYPPDTAQNGSGQGMAEGKDKGSRTFVYVLACFATIGLSLIHI